MKLLSLFCAALTLPLVGDPVAGNQVAGNPVAGNSVAGNPVAGHGSDLKPDPKAIFGALDNGFRYVIYPNDEPPEKFSVRLHIAAGSLMEEDNQRGVAHFLEHMVFNGSKNFTSDELDPIMQRLGIQLGAHANAYTSFDETVYMLDLPNLEPDTMDLTFTVMRDFADGALLAEEEIDKERGVILSEKTSRDSVGYRMMVRQFEYLLPGSRLLSRLPIGTEEVIKNATRERFTDFYQSYYIPKRMTFVVAGDFDPKKMETRVRETFISMTNPETLAEDPAPDLPPTGHGLQVEVFSDPEIPSAGLSLYSLRKYQPKQDSAAERRSIIPLSVANDILNQRLQILSRKEGSPILDGNAFRLVLFNQMEQGSVEVTPAKDKWEEALPLLEQEVRKMVSYGVTQAELDEAKARTLNFAQQMVKRKDTRRSEEIAMMIVSNIGQDKVFTTPETDLAIIDKALAEITPEACNQAFNTFWETKDVSLLLTTPGEPEGGSKRVKDLFLKSREVKVEPPLDEALAPFAYTDFGKKGEVLKTTSLEDLEVTQLTLSNDIRVNLKPTEFQKNSINLTVTFGTGQLSQPDDTPGLERLASLLIQAGGLGKHSQDELQRILAGKNVSTGFSINPDQFSLSGRTTPDDLELQLQLMCAQLTDPGFRSEAKRMYHQSLPIFYQQMKHSLSGAFAQLNQDLYGGDFRAAIPDEDQASAYQIQTVKDWLLPAFEKAPLELTLVGDFELSKATDLILQSFGALPERTPATEDLSARRKITFPKVPGQKLYNFDSQDPSAAAVAIWSIPSDWTKVGPVRRLNVLSAILNDRLRKKIREELGGSYSPRAGVTGSTGLTIAYLQAVAQVKPSETKKYGELIIQLADQMARDGVSEDELQRALNPIKTNLEESSRKNSYWLRTVLSRSQLEPYRLDWARKRDTDYAGITVDELNQLAAKYLTKDKALLYELIPKTSKEKIDEKKSD